jgi:hypothetical protein
MAPGAIEAIGLSPTDLDDLIAAFTVSFHAKINATVRAGGFVFDLLNTAGWQETNVTSAPATCAAVMRDFCGANGPAQSAPLLLEMTRVDHKTPWPLPFPEQNLAEFLLVRGPYAWIGYGWSGCQTPSTFVRPESFDVDYGTPLNFCLEASAGVFTRNYTHADVSLDCNSFTASISMK